MANVNEGIGGGLEISDGIVGAAGQFIAAVLETAGLYLQSQILENFAPLFQYLGALVYLVAAIGAILSIAQFGNYRMGAYFLMGPAMFWWVLTATNPVVATGHINGTREGNTASEQIGLLKYAGASSRYENARVSQFFVYYDSLISNIIQRTVGFLLDTENKKDLLFAARERVMSRVLKNKVSEKDFLLLLSKGLMGNCAKVIALKKEISSPRLQNANPADSEYEQKLKEREDKQSLYEELAIRPVAIDDGMRSYITALGFEPGENVTCEELWEYTKEACLIKAEADLKPQQADLASETDVNWDEVYASVKEKLVAKDEDPAKALEILAAYYLKNSIAQTAHSSMTNSIASREPWDQSQRKFIMGNMASHQASGRLVEIAYFAGSVPYIQGVLLYLLAGAFPFFSFFLLIPGRASSFFSWMALWLWVKSWDVGFALILIIRDLFWQSMPHAGEIRTSGTWGTFDKLDWNDPASVLNLVYLNDPTAHINTYYTIIAVLTLGVPAITAHLCLGATNLYNALKMSIDGQADRFGAEATNASARGEAANVHGHLEYKEAQKSALAARKALRNPGETAAGLPRGQTGDGAKGRYARGEAESESFHFSFGDEQVNRANRRAALTRRSMSWRHLTSDREISAGVNKERENYETRHAAKGNHIPFIGSPLSDNTNVDLGRGVGPTVVVAAGEGGGSGD